MDNYRSEREQSCALSVVYFLLIIFDKEICAREVWLDLNLM